MTPAFESTIIYQPMWPETQTEKNCLLLLQGCRSISNALQVTLASTIFLRWQCRGQHWRANNILYPCPLASSFTLGNILRPHPLRHFCIINYSNSDVIAPPHICSKTAYWWSSFMLPQTDFTIFIVEGSGPSGGESNVLGNFVNASEKFSENPVKIKCFGIVEFCPLFFLISRHRWKVFFQNQQKDLKTVDYIVTRDLRRKTWESLLSAVHCKQL